jgi:Mg2+ and Co2+ transporter CorA
MINAYYYDSSGQDRSLTLGNRLPRLTSRQLLWIDVVGRNPDELAEVGKLLGLHRNCVGDLERLESRFELKTYGTYLHFDLASLVSEDHQPDLPPHPPQAIKLDFVVGKLWLVTVHDEDLLFLRAFRDQDKGQTRIGRLSSAGLASTLLDWHFGPFLGASEALEDTCDVLDSTILAEPVLSRQVLSAILDGRNRISQLRELLVPQRAVFYGLSRADIALVIGSPNENLFNHLEQRFERVLDVVERVRDIARGSFELYSMRVNELTNVLIRRLTVISIVLGAIGAVAGLFGMNFDTPYSHTGAHGFWIVVFGLGTLAMAFCLAAWRKKWI